MLLKPYNYSGRALSNSDLEIYFSSFSRTFCPYCDGDFFIISSHYVPPINEDMEDVEVFNRDPCPYCDEAHEIFAMLLNVQYFSIKTWMLTFKRLRSFLREPYWPD